MRTAYSLGFVWILLLAIPVAAQSSRIYVLNGKGTTVDVIDPATNKIVQRIEGIPGAAGVVFSSDGSRAYITTETEDALYAVDTNTGKILKRVVLSPGGANLPVITKDGSRLFVCLNGVRNAAGQMQSQLGGAIDIVDTSTLKIVKTLPQKGGMHDCYSTPDGKYVIGGSLGGKFLEVLDAQTGEQLWEVNFDKGVSTIAQELGPDGSTRRLFVPLSRFRGFAVVDFSEHKEVARIPLPDEPNGFLLEGFMARENVTPTHGDAISPDGKTLWVVSRGSNGVFVYSLPELKVIKFIHTSGDQGAPGGPSWITFTPDGKTAYVPNTAADSVSAIDAKSMKEVAVIPADGKETDHVFTLVLP